MKRKPSTTRPLPRLNWQQRRFRSALRIVLNPAGHSSEVLADAAITILPAFDGPQCARIAAAFTAGARQLA